MKKKEKRLPTPEKARQIFRKMIADTSKPLPFITDEPSIYDFIHQRKRRKSDHTL